jgi:hypothetical protein
MSDPFLHGILKTITSISQFMVDINCPQAVS